MFRLTSTSTQQVLPGGDRASDVSSRQYRVDVWQMTKQVLDQGFYSPFADGATQSVMLPPLCTDIQAVALTSLPPPQASRPRAPNITAGAVAASSVATTSESDDVVPLSASSALPASPSLASPPIGNTPVSKAERAAQPQRGPPSGKPAPLRVSVYRGDCLDAARDLFERDCAPPLVMDAASSRHFGGGYTRGARAQEEEMCRRTSLALQVDTQWRRQRNNLYPIAPGTGIYVPGTSVFRAGSKQNYAFLPRPFAVAFGIVAAQNEPPLAANGARLAPEAAASLLATLRCFFRMAAAMGHRTVVPVALGCGAFKNPAGHVAELMMSAIASECPNTCVEEVRIAVFDDHNAVRRGNEEGNFAPFARCARQQFGPTTEIIEASEQ